MVHSYVDEFNLVNKIKILQDQLSSTTGVIQINAGEVVRIYASIPGMNEVVWCNNWNNLNNELAQILNVPSDIGQKRQNILDNIGKRIVFYKEKRGALTNHKLILANIFVGISQANGVIEGYIANGRAMELQIGEVAEELRDRAYSRSLMGDNRVIWTPVLPNFQPSLNLFNDAKSKANAVSVLETEVCRKISECDTETFRLEKLFLAMKRNQMQLDQMIQIDAPSIQGALANGVVINFPGQNGIGSDSD